MEHNDNAEGTTIGELLKKILNETKDTKDATFNRIAVVESKVDDHDKGIMVMSSTLDRIHDAMKDFSEATKAMQSDMRAFQKEFQESQAKHWQAQDKQAMQTQNILEKLANNDMRMLSVERNQVNGCPSFFEL